MLLSADAGARSSVPVREGQDHSRKGYAREVRDPISGASTAKQHDVYRQVRTASTHVVEECLGIGHETRAHH
jgi:hypothetical protein